MSGTCTWCGGGGIRFGITCWYCQGSGSPAPDDPGMAALTTAAGALAEPIGLPFDPPAKTLTVPEHRVLCGRIRLTVMRRDTISLDADGALRALRLLNERDALLAEALTALEARHV